MSQILHAFSPFRYVSRRRYEHGVHQGLQAFSVKLLQSETN